jgi:hypothetical protein
LEKVAYTMLIISEMAQFHSKKNTRRYREVETTGRWRVGNDSSGSF